VGTAPHPLLSLSDWFKCAHLYETYHQVHQLVYYMHPGRFVDRVLRDKGPANAMHPGPAPTAPDRTLEELILILQPLSQHPLGLTLPSFYQGSPMPDLSKLEPSWGCLRRNGANLAAANQPDWRSLYYPTVRHRDINTARELWIPFSWIPKALRKTLHLMEPQTGPEAWDHGYINHYGVSIVTVLDRRLSCEPTERQGPIIGPSKFAGRGKMSATTLARVDDLLASFATNEPCWAVRSPDGSAVLGSPDSLPGPSPRVASPPTFLSGAGVPLPAAMLQLPAAQVAAPVCIAWYYRQNSARLEWALENGMSIGQIRVSPATGLIEFPGMTDADFFHLGDGA
jgi:hypothetical protein